MKTSRLLFVFFAMLFVNFEDSFCDDESNKPKVVIIGAGPAGIAASSKLFENGFKDVTILEAENRIGGRVYTTKLGEYNVDLGGQWVHGEEGNAAFKLAYPLGLLDNSEDSLKDFLESVYVDSKGNVLQENIRKNLTKFFFEDIHEATFDARTPYDSLGQYADKKFYEKFQDVPEVMENKKKYLHLMEMLSIGSESALTWYDVSTRAGNRYKEYEGDFLTNWKTRGYSTILEILMKRYPDPEKELPVLNNTFLNMEVVAIDYSNSSSPILVSLSNGQLCTADHVIVTVSLGVLKEKHKSLFVPPLPEKKVQAIEGLGFGNVGKIFLLFDKPFWDLGDKKLLSFNFMWNDDDRKAIESDPEKAWMMGLTSVMTVNHKPNLLQLWISGNYSKAMEELPWEKVFNHTQEALHRFLGKLYNVTTPINMLKTRWYSNPHFRGTYSYPSIETARKNVSAEMLEEPVNLDDLTILFAGEATDSDRFSTVDGAIESGWKAADRLIERYNKNVKQDSIIARLG